MKPGAMTAFQVLAWLAVAVIFAVAIYDIILLASFRGHVEDYLIGVGIPFAIGALLAGTVIGTSARSMAGRVMFTILGGILIALTLFAVIGSLIDGGALDPIALISCLLGFFLLTGAIICVFQGSVNRWFREKADARYHGYAGAYPQSGHGHPDWSQPAQPTGSWQAPPQAWSAAGAGGQGAGTASGTRPCPHCAEQIRVEASKCRFCGSAVQPLI